MRRNILGLAASFVVACGTNDDTEPLTEANNGALPGMSVPATGGMPDTSDTENAVADGGVGDTGGSVADGDVAAPAASGAMEASGSAPPVAPCTGCVELVAPVSGANSATNLQDQVGYQFNLPAPGADFRNGRITWRIMALMSNDNLFASLYAQNGAPDYSNVYPGGPALNSMSFPPGTWVDLTLDLAAYGYPPGIAGAEAGGAALIDPGAFDKTRVESFGIQLRTGSAFTGTRAIQVLVDSVTIEGVTGQSTRSFDTGADGLGVNQYQVPLGTQPPLHH